MRGNHRCVALGAQPVDHVDDACTHGSARSRRALRARRAPSSLWHAINQSSRPHTYVCKCMHGVCRTGCKLYTSRTCAVRIGVELRGFLAPGSERRKVHFTALRGLTPRGPEKGRSSKRPPRLPWRSLRQTWSPAGTGSCLRMRRIRNLSQSPHWPWTKFRPAMPRHGVKGGTAQRGALEA